MIRIITDFDDIQTAIYNFGKDETDFLLKTQISRLSKVIKQYRLKLMDLKDNLDDQNNSDVIRHLEYEISEHETFVHDHLEVLNKANNLYIDFMQLN